MGAREFFESVREASLDAERCRRQLEAMEQRALAIGSPSFDARVSGGDHDRLARDVASLVDREGKLQSRIDGDYDLIDLACAVLYGDDGISDGLAAIAPPWWADAIYHRYVAARTVPETARLVGYSTRHVQGCVRAAFEIMDANGMVSTIAGQGIAEGRP